MSKLKVAFDASATPPALTGAGYYVAEIIKQLNARDEIDLTIITRNSDVIRFEQLAPDSKVIGAAPDHIAKRLIFQNLSIGKLVDSLNVDLFHGPHYQLPLNIKTPCVVTIHDMTLISHKNVHKKTKSIYFSRVIPAAVKKASSIISVSEHTKKDIEKYFSDSSPITVAQLGFDKKRFTPEEKNDHEVLKARGIEGKYIAYLGLLEPRKCIPDLIAAFSEVAREHSDLKLVIAGNDGWRISEVREAIKSSGFATKIVLPRRLSDEEVPCFYRQAKAFVYPSMYEGFGMPVLEAMACGAPVITTNSSSLSEVANDSALLVPPRNPDELAKAISNILSSPKLAEELREKSLARAKHFSWENCADKHIDAYKLANT